MDPSPADEQVAALRTATALADRWAAAGDAAGRLHPEVVDALVRAEAFKLFVPAALGGPQRSLPEACDVIAAVAEADPAAGWAVMIGAGPNWFAGSMQPPLAAAVFAGSGAIAGSGQFGQATVAAQDHWRVRGTWRYCSGAPWAEWFTYNAALDDGTTATIAVPAAEVDVDRSSWDVRAMRATASFTTMLHDVTVPPGHRFQVREEAPVRPEPIFRVPFVVFGQVLMAAVSVGAARRLLDGFTELVRTKPSTHGGPPPAEDRVVLDALARRHGAVTAAARRFEHEVGALWEAVAADGPGVGADGGQAVRCVGAQTAALHAVHEGAGAAHAVWEHSGMSVLPQASTLGRVAAGLTAVGQNALVSAARFAELGRALIDGAP